MGLTVRSIAAFMEEWAPLCYAEAYDNPGLILGHQEAPVKTVVVSVDASRSVIEFAKEHQAQMIITHHPLIFHAIKTLKDTDPLGSRLLSLSEEKIALYSAHTNLDSAPGGNNDHAAALLGLRKVRAVSEEGEIPCLRVGELSQRMTLSELADHVRDRWGLSTLKLFAAASFLQEEGNGKKVKNVALCTGSGMDFWPLAKKEGAEVFLTGDISYHRADDALSQGMCLIDAGHFETDRLSVSYLKDRLEDFSKQAGEPLTVLIAPEEAPGEVL